MNEFITMIVPGNFTMSLEQFVALMKLIFSMFLLGIYLLILDFFDNNFYLLIFFSF